MELKAFLFDFKDNFFWKKNKNPFCTCKGLFKNPTNCPLHSPLLDYDPMGKNKHLKKLKGGKK